MSDNSRWMNAWYQQWRLHSYTPHQQWQRKVQWRFVSGNIMGDGLQQQRVFSSYTHGLCTDNASEAGGLGNYTCCKFLRPKFLHLKLMSLPCHGGRPYYCTISFLLALNCSQSIAVNFWCQGLWTHTFMPLHSVELVLGMTGHSLNGFQHFMLTLRLHSEMQHLQGNSQWNLWYEHLHH